jgi:hypothetical protein
VNEGTNNPDIAYELPREVQLIIDRASEGLLDEQAENELRRTVPLAADAITPYDVAAASLFLATVSADASTTLPRSLEQRLQQAGRSWCTQHKAASQGSSSPSTVTPLVLRSAGRDEPGVSTPIEPSPSRLRILPWLAAAAGVALAAAAWWPAAPRATQLSDAPLINLPPTVQQHYQRLAGSSAALKLRFADWADANVPCEKPGVQGEVLWDEARKVGVMKFANLPKLDASKELYQLWIIDSRGMEQRISGGVFNGEDVLQYVVIDPGIQVDGAAAFAITIERPDGVWVSDMKRRVVIAAAG